MWSDWLVVCDCGFSLSALWCPLSVPTVLLGFLLPWTWLLQQSAADAPHLGYGFSPHGRSSWLWTWYLLSTAAPDLGCRVSPLFRSLLQCGAATARRSDFGTSAYLKLFWGYHLEDIVSFTCLTVLQEHVAPTLIRPVSTAGVSCDLHINHQNYGKFPTHMRRFLSSIFISLFNLS